MTLAQAQKVYAAQLKNTSSTPSLDIDIFLIELLSVRRAHLLAYPEQQLTDDQQHGLSAWVKRRLKGEPVAYIVGHQAFWTLDLKVTPETLIPRPETELLVEWILNAFPQAQTKSLLDLGTGTGAIALSIAKERASWSITAVDRSSAAITVAKENAQTHQINTVDFVTGSWFSPLSDYQPFDIIVSNPPYVCMEDPHLLELSYEPESALIAGPEGMDDIVEIVARAPDYLSSNGVIVIEHGYDQALSVSAVLAERGFVEICTHKDYAGQPRFATATWKGA